MGDIVILDATTTPQIIRIREMIQEFAIFSKMPDGPEVEAGELNEAINKERRLLAFVAEQKSGNQCEKAACLGYMLATPMLTLVRQERGLFLETLYVQSKSRGIGIGRKLMKHLCKFALTHNYTFIHWHVLVRNKPAIEFYDKIGGLDLKRKFGLSSFRMYKEQMEGFQVKFETSRMQTDVFVIENLDRDKRKAVDNVGSLIREFQTEKGNYLRLSSTGSDCSDSQDVQNFLKYPNCKIFAMHMKDNTENSLGFASTYETFSSWEGRVLIIDCLFVTSRARRKGIGTALMLYIVQHALSERMRHITWWWNCNDYSMVKRFDGIGAVGLFKALEWLEYRLESGDIQRMVDQ